MAVERKQVVIRNVEYISSSKNGNPRFRVHAEQGSWTTAPDAAVARGIENSEYRGEVILTLDGGSIVGVSTVDGTHFAGRQG
ncbi:hypothetical protein GS896_27330 [Rhodococcus hoagii]|nr:hypothetical protein [Prescottella equi]MBM4653964.1 hypothetical protein [Prescottella equi]MBM4719771.1 hypothetical protein [Prescottella equi]NKR23570.1 hypothetical protein [Prescottella equi]NKT56276.1 hypothetical protein [Prescottella equi]